MITCLQCTDMDTKHEVRGKAHQVKRGVRSISQMSCYFSLCSRWTHFLHFEVQHRAPARGQRSQTHHLQVVTINDDDDKSAAFMWTGVWHLQIPSELFSSRSGWSWAGTVRMSPCETTLHNNRTGMTGDSSYIWIKVSLTWIYHQEVRNWRDKQVKFSCEPFPLESIFTQTAKKVTSTLILRALADLGVLKCSASRLS